MIVQKQTDEIQMGWTEFENIIDHIKKWWHHR